MSPLASARKFGIDTRGTAFDSACRVSRLSRHEVRLNRKAYNQTIRNGIGRSSMVNMGKPQGYKPVPYFTGDREKRLFAAWRKRLEAGKLG